MIELFIIIIIRPRIRMRVIDEKRGVGRNSIFFTTKKWIFQKRMQTRFSDVLLLSQLALFTIVRGDWREYVRLVEK